MQITTFSNYRRSDEEVQWRTLSPPYFEGGYLRDCIYRLHPEFEGGNVDQQFEEAIDRLWPEHPDGPRNCIVAC